MIGDQNSISGGYIQCRKTTHKRPPHTSSLNPSDGILSEQQPQADASSRQETADRYRKQTGRKQTGVYRSSNRSAHRLRGLDNSSEQRIHCEEDRSPELKRLMIYLSSSDLLPSGHDTSLCVFRGMHVR